VSQSGSLVKLISQLSKVILLHGVRQPIESIGQAVESSQPAALSQAASQLSRVSQSVESS